MAQTGEWDRKGGEKRTREEMPDYIQALPEKAQVAWLNDEFDWDGRKLGSREPVVKAKPGKSVAELLIRQPR